VKEQHWEEMGAGKGLGREVRLAGHKGMELILRQNGFHSFKSGESAENQDPYVACARR